MCLSLVDRTACWRTFVDVCQISNECLSNEIDYLSINLSNKLFGALKGLLGVLKDQDSSNGETSQH